MQKAGIFITMRHWRFFAFSLTIWMQNNMQYFYPLK